MTDKHETERQIQMLRDQLAQLQAQLQSLESLRAVLGDEATEQSTAPLLERIGELQDKIQTGGGAVVFGDVPMGNGDFVGRDKHETHYHAAPEPPDVTPLREAYLRQVATRTSRLPLRGVDVGAGDPTRGTRPRLAQVYVDLDTTRWVPVKPEEKR